MTELEVETESDEDYGSYPDYPVGELLECYECQPHETTDDDGFPCSMRRCVERGPVVGRADPTQTYKLECGHTVI